MTIYINGKSVGTIKGGLKSEVTLKGLGTKGDIDLTINQHTIVVKVYNTAIGKLVSIDSLAEK